MRPMPRKWKDIIRAILYEEGLISHDDYHDFVTDGYGFVLDDNWDEQEVNIYHLKDSEQVIEVLGRRDIHAILVPETRQQAAYVKVPKAYDDQTEEQKQFSAALDRLSRKIFDMVGERGSTGRGILVLACAALCGVTML